MHLPLAANIIFWAICIAIAIPKNKNTRRLATFLAFGWLIVNLLNDYLRVHDYVSGNALLFSLIVIGLMEGEKIWKRKKQSIS